MKKSKKWLLSSGLMGLVLLFAPQQGQALSLNVGSATVNVGDTFSINVSVVDAVELTSWQLDLAYDPSLLQANSVTEGPFLSSFGATLFVPGFIDNATGLISGVSNFFVDLPPNPSGSGVLATIEFTALASGTSPFTATNIFLDGISLNRDSGVPVTSGSGCVQGDTACGGGNPVPETSSLWLVLSGGLLLWGLPRWRDHLTMKN